jgi:hypothetical protein
MQNLTEEENHVVCDILNDSLIYKDEAFRLFCAIKFRAKNDSETRKFFWWNMMRELVIHTKKDYLVPDHMNSKEWESFLNSPKIDLSL